MRAGLFLLVGTLVTTNYQGWCQSQIKCLYAFDTWAGQTKVHYEKTVTNWVPDLASLGATNVLRRDEGVWTNFQKFSEYNFESGTVPGTVRLIILEHQDVTNAQSAMLDFFSTCAAPQPFPLGFALGVDMGDRCYLGWGPAENWISFVRNNVFVSVSLEDQSVLALAKKLDCELVRHSFTGPVLLDAGKSGSTFHVSVPTTVSNTYVLEHKDALSGTNWSGSLSLTGDGTIRLITYPAFSDQEFFRLRVQ